MQRFSDHVVGMVRGSLNLSRVSALAAVALLSLATNGVAAAALPACATPQLSGFETGSDPAEGFSRTQLQRGEITLTADPVDGGNRAAFMSAERKRGGEVGKSDLILAFSPVGAGRTIEMGGRFLFPAESRLDSLILMDLECASCGLDTNPGIRLYLRDGLLRVDRSKIGIEEPFLPGVPLALKTGGWHEIRWEVTLGIGAAGRSRVFVDGRQVLDAQGTTLLSQAVVKQFAPIKVREQADRFQIGLTANSNTTRQSLYLDDVSICAR